MLYLIVLAITNTGAYSYNTYDFRSFTTALVNYDRKQTEATADTGRASYAIKVMDATGNVLKAEELALMP